ncbi:hypothetical protein GEV33_011880 [Tenebrio molitor]|uniref:Uncharacterized protein n=1 Tax=Tenebrio molitor TaxID=7067 RepID=A0A8J6HAV4_TENMO|nr:hypothetical protein GEV33_011880 [Tenebrio molitor]
MEARSNSGTTSRFRGTSNFYTSEYYSNFPGSFKTSRRRLRNTELRNHAAARLCSQTKRSSSRRTMVVLRCIDHETADMMNATLNRPNDSVAFLLTYGGGFLLLVLGILENVMRPSVTRVYPNQNFIFQQDNCSVHTSHRVATWFQDQNINVLAWPSRINALCRRYTMLRTPSKAEWLIVRRIASKDFFQTFDENIRWFDARLHDLFELQSSFQFLGGHSGGVSCIVMVRIDVTIRIYDHRCRVSRTVPDFKRAGPDCGDGQLLNLPFKMYLESKFADRPQSGPYLYRYNFNSAAILPSMYR